MFAIARSFRGLPATGRSFLGQYPTPVISLLPQTCSSPFSSSPDGVQSIPYPPTDSKNISLLRTVLEKKGVRQPLPIYHQQRYKNSKHGRIRLAKYIRKPEVTVSHPLPPPREPVPGVAYIPNPPHTEYFAVVDINSTQYRVSKDDEVMVQLLHEDVGTRLILPKVLLLGSRDSTVIGRPHVQNACVEVIVEEQNKLDRIIAFKKKRRKHSQRTRTNRPPVTIVRVLNIFYDQVDGLQMPDYARDIYKAYDKGEYKRTEKYRKRHFSIP